MKKEDFNKLILNYNAFKASDALAWFRENHSEEFRNSLANQYQYCVDNEYLWNKE